MKHEPLRYAHDEGHTDVCYSSDGSKFVTCGADGDIRIWSVEESEDPIHKCIGEWALCVRQKDDDLYIATGSNDIQILKFPEGERNGVLERFVAPINHIAICDEYIALAGEDMEVKLINLAQSEKNVIIFDKLAGPCFSVALSANSKYLAAGAGDGKLRVWNIESKALLKEFDCFPKVNSFSNAKMLCRMDFEPTCGRYLAYPEKNTVVLLKTNNWSHHSTLSASNVLSSSSFSIVQFSPCGKYLLAVTVEGDFVIWCVTSESVHNSSKHSKPISICGLMWDPSGSGNVVYTDVEGQLGIMTDCVPEIIEEAPTPEKVSDEFKDDKFDELEFNLASEDDDEDNENAVSVEKLKKQYMPDSEPELNMDAMSSHMPTPRPRTPETQLQSPFMPSSTPEHLNPRYLCWNEVGVIRSYGVTDEDSSKLIEVEFHDTSFHSSIMLQNYQDYVMGVVSSGVVAVANSSQMSVIPLSASSKEWLLKTEEFEEIVLLAASANLVCLATNNYIVRICSIFGTQRGIVSIPGPLISMSAYRNCLLVAYHSAGPRKGDQCVNIKLIKFQGLTMESKDLQSALGPESTLLWLGFSDEGVPAMIDSLGMLSLHPHNCNVWIPFCDTSKFRKNVSDGFFVTAVFEKYQTVAGIKCKGSIYPGFTPRPTICELPLEPPFAELTTEKSQMEMNLFTWSNTKVDDMDKKFKETGLKTFALACRNDLDQRALEFMEIISNPHLLKLSIKYASKLNKKRLSEKLMDLAKDIVDEDESTSFSLPMRESQEIKPIRSLNRKHLTVSSIKSTPKTKITQEEICTPDIFEDDKNSTQNSTITESFNETTENISFSEENVNPFLKNAKKVEEKNKNPLSLTNKFAGYEFDDEEKIKKAEGGEKRKNPESGSEKQREKQRKLDRFMFTKRS